MLGSGRSSKNDSNDALSAAVAALRHRRLRTDTAEDHGAVCRMLAVRLHDLTAERTRAICRLHALLAAMVAGGAGRSRLTADQAAAVLRRVRPLGPVETERKHQARVLLGDVRRLDRELLELKARITIEVTATDTTLTDIFGVGPIVACLLIGHTGDIGRFGSADHFANYNGTAPIEASSGPKVRHRLNPRGNRQLNHALHMAAVTQVAHDTPGRVYYQRKLADGKTTKEALRALKRRISDAVYRQLVADHQR